MGGLCDIVFLLIFSFFSDFLRDHLSIPFCAHKLLKSFYEGVMFLVFNQNSAVFIHQFGSRSLTISENRYAKQHRFHGSDSVAFFGEVDQTSGLADDFDFFIDIIDPSDEND